MAVCKYQVLQETGAEPIVKTLPEFEAKFNGVVNERTEEIFRSLCETEVFSFDTSKEVVSTHGLCMTTQEKRDEMQIHFHKEMGFCQNIDEFFDIALKVGDSYIKVCSHILKARSPFFEAMLSSANGFKEFFTPGTTNHKQH